MAAGCAAALCAVWTASSPCLASGAAAVSEIRIEVPDGLGPELPGEAGRALARETGSARAELAFGSGLAFVGLQRDGSDRLVAVTDRGPSCAGPRVSDGEEELPSRVYLHPGYAPSVVELVLSADRKVLRVTESRPALRSGVPYSGLPQKTARSYSLRYSEVPLNSSLRVLEATGPSISPRGIGYNRDGNFWIADASLPSLVLLSGKNLNEITRAVPGRGLPRELAWEAMDSGFSGLAVLPSGHVVTAMHPGQNTKAPGRRFAVLLDASPSDWTSSAYAYPAPEGWKRFEVRAFAHAGGASLLALESGADASGRSRTRLVRFSFKGADDITGAALPGGRSVDFSDWKVLRRAGVRPVKPQVLAELEIGREAKPGAMAVVDPQTVLVLSDSGYGLRCDAPAGHPRGGYRLQGREVIPKPEAGPVPRSTGQRTRAWLVRFSTPLL